MERPTRLVMFDIDGTLTQTYEADTECLLKALVDVFDFTEVDPDWSIYPRCSDAGILESLFQARQGARQTERRAGVKTGFVAPP